MTTTSGTEDADFRIEEIRFESEPGVPVSARMYLPKGAGRKPAVVMFEEKRLPVPLYVQRSQSTAAIAEALARSGQIVMEVDPRDSPGANDGRPFLGNWLTNERADLVGRNLAAMRAHDLLVAVDVLAARPDVDAKSIRGYSRGVKGVWLLLAAAVDQRLGKIWLDRTPWSIAAALEGPLTNHLFDAMIPRFALHWDFQDLVDAMGDRRVFWTDPTNWMNRVVPLGEPLSIPLRRRRRRAFDQRIPTLGLSWRLRAFFRWLWLVANDNDVELGDECGDCSDGGKKWSHDDADSSNSHRNLDECVAMLVLHNDPLNIAFMDQVSDFVHEVAPKDLNLFSKIIEAHSFIYVGRGSKVPRLGRECAPLGANQSCLGEITQMLATQRR